MLTAPYSALSHKHAPPLPIQLETPPLLPSEDRPSRLSIGTALRRGPRPPAGKKKGGVGGGMGDESAGCGMVLMLREVHPAGVGVGVGEKPGTDSLAAAA